MGMWFKHLGRMYQVRGTDEEGHGISHIKLRGFPSAIERRHYQRRRNWIDPDPNSVRLFRRKQIRRKDEL
jgi:hypothetical protein